MEKYILPNMLIGLSVSDNRDDAIKERKINTAYLLDDHENDEECACGHAIRHVFELYNKKNNNRINIGNECIHKIFKTEQLDLRKVFDGLSNIIKIQEASPSKDLITYCYKKKIIDDWERKFLLDRYRKKYAIASDKQYFKKLEINKKIINAFRKHTNDDI